MESKSNVDKPHPHPHVRHLQQLKRQIDETHARVYEFLLTLSEGINAGHYDTKTLIDIGFLCREAADRSDDTRKEVNKREEVCEMKIAYDMAMKTAAGEDVQDPMHATLASGSPSIRMECPQPRIGSPENTAFIESFGVSHTVAEALSRMFKPDWKALSTLVTERTVRGERLPPGLQGKMYSRYSTTFRRKSG